MDPCGAPCLSKMCIPVPRHPTRAEYLMAFEVLRDVGGNLNPNHQSNKKRVFRLTPSRA